MKEVRMVVEGCSQWCGQYLWKDPEVRDQEIQKNRKATTSGTNSFLPSSQQHQGVVGNLPLSSEAG